MEIERRCSKTHMMRIIDTSYWKEGKPKYPGSKKWLFEFDGKILNDNEIKRLKKHHLDDETQKIIIELGRKIENHNKPLIWNSEVRSLWEIFDEKQKVLT